MTKINDVQALIETGVDATVAAQLVYGQNNSRATAKKVALKTQKASKGDTKGLEAWKKRLKTGKSISLTSGRRAMVAIDPEKGLCYLEAPYKIDGETSWMRAGKTLTAEIQKAYN